MKLTVAQKEEIGDSILKFTRFRETYNEVYDHILNAFEYSESKYSTIRLNEILKDDFGGVNNIIENELQYALESNKSFSKNYRQEIANLFKWPNLTGTLTIVTLLFIISRSIKSDEFNVNPSLIGLMILNLGVILSFFVKIYIMDRHEKLPSIKDAFLLRISKLGIVFYNCVFFLFLNQGALIEFGYQAKSMFALFLYFLTTIYVRSLIHFYKKRIKVVTL